MSDFFNAITSFPTVIFTVLLLISFGFWIVSTVLGFGMDALEIDAGGDTDAGRFTNLNGFLGAFGLAGVPIVIVTTLASLFGWLISLVGMELIGARNSVIMFAGGLITFFVAMIGGMFIAGLAAKPIAPLLVPDIAQNRLDFVGKAGVVRTQKVTATFGQAEVTDQEGATVLVQIRERDDNTLGYGDTVLLIDFDDHIEAYRVTEVPNFDD